MFVVTGINILQKGGKYDGRSMEKILDVLPEKATIDDIKKLSKADVFQLTTPLPCHLFRISRVNMPQRRWM
jgi:hypothetical protein